MAKNRARIRRYELGILMVDLVDTNPPIEAKALGISDGSGRNLRERLGKIPPGTEVDIEWEAGTRTIDGRERRGGWLRKILG